MLNNKWSSPDQILASNSCLTGGGAHCGKYYMHFQFPPKVLRYCQHINQLECVVLVVAVARWAQNFARARLVVNCDNQVTVAAINSGNSCNPVLQRCLRYLHRIMALQDFDIRAVYLNTSQNRVTNSLSHFHLGISHQSQFKEFAKGKHMVRAVVTEEDFAFLFE